MKIDEKYYSEKMMKKVLGFLQADATFRCLETKGDKAEAVIAIANEMIEFATNLISKGKEKGTN